MKNFFLSAFLLMATLLEMTAQDINDNEIIKFRYTLVPSAGNLYWGNYEVDLSPKISIGEQSKLGAIVSYDKTMYSFFDTTPAIDTDSFEEIHQIKTGVFYETLFSDTWGVTILFSPVVSSNLATKITSEDVQFFGKFTMSKQWNGDEKNIRLRLGIGYGALFGTPDFYPILAVAGTFNEKWEYQVGFPEMFLEYAPGDRHRISTGVQSKGYYANLSNNLRINGASTYTNGKLSYEAIDVGIRHTYRLQSGLSSVVKIGYLSRNALQLLDTSDNELNTFDTGGSVYIAMGLTINLKNKLDENND